MPPLSLSEARLAHKPGRINVDVGGISVVINKVSVRFSRNACKIDNPSANANSPALLKLPSTS